MDGYIYLLACLHTKVIVATGFEIFPSTARVLSLTFIRWRTMDVSERVL